MLSVTKNTKPYVFIIISAIFLSIFYLSQYFHEKTHSQELEFKNLYQQIDIQSVKLDNVTREISETLIFHKDLYHKPVDSILRDTKFLCFIAFNDSIVYWNNTSVNPENFTVLKNDNSTHCIKLPSGWYLYQDNIINDYEVVLLDLIKSDYQMNNPLILPGFNPEYSRSENIRLTLDELKSTWSIKSKDDEFLLGVNFANSDDEKHHANVLVFACFILSLIFLVIAINNSLCRIQLLKNKHELFQVAFIAIIGLIWGILHLTGFPALLKDSPIFNTGNYDLLATNSTGDFFINVIFLSIIAVFSYVTSEKSNSDPSPVSIIFKYTLFWLFILVAFCFIHSATQQHNFTYISGLFFKAPGIIIATISILILNLGLYYSIHAFLRSERDSNINFFIAFLIVFFGEFIVYLLFDIQIHVLLLTFITAMIVILIRYLVWNRLSDIFLKNIILLLVLSIVSAVLINMSLKQKEDNYQKYIANVLSTPNDKVFEKLFSDLLPTIKSDTLLKELVLKDSTGIELSSYLKDFYFNGYMDKYNIQITNCGNDELIEIQPEGEIYNCRDYFTTLIHDFTIKSIDTVLFQFNSETEGYYYICNLKFSDPNDPENEKTLFVEFVSSHVPEGLGYPELLMDSESQTLNLSNFSFARYKDNILIYKFGEFAYNTYFTSSGPVQYNSFFNYKHSRHFITIPEDGSFLIVTRKGSSLTMKVVIFSIIFILLSLISVLIYLLAYARRAFSLFRINFKTRLQTFVIGTLTITFILIAVSTLLYIEENTKIEMEKQLTEKANSVLIELQHKLSTVSDFKDEDKDFLHQLLRKFSLVFFSDINLYDKSGKLIATSRPEVFDKNLLSTYINPDAYKAIFIDNELNYITEEKIGSLEYYSSYVPINLNNYFPIGIVNLPYFARQSEYTQSYYIMLSYLINIYVIIGIIGTIIAVTFSRYLTRPLVLLQDSISNIRIDKQNEKIDWGKNDEIGLLIAEYNRMVDKLEQSAGLLARSERESAWREVAQQIAHEIKNPLTPMKLNVQYLEKAYKNNDPEFSSKIDSISSSLIAQIDTLDNVAEMFSNFAKNKGLVFEDVDLKKVLTTARDLFDKKSNVNIVIEYKNDPGELIILGFEKDILRVINNIIKNAIQAVENIKSGLIEIVVSSNDNYIEVAISDNGKGIPDDMKSSIFQPYFTTKTSGTGLGLAIVRNIVNETGGEVFFESTVNKGTTFYLRFKKVK